MSLRYRLHDSYNAHSLDTATSDSTNITTNNVQNKQWNSHTTIQVCESKVD